MQRWLSMPIDRIAPTFGFQIHTLSTPKGFLLNLWDIGGQKAIRAFWRNYFEETDGLVWVVDSSMPERLEAGCEELWQVLGEQRLATATLLILANKQDLPGAMSLEEISIGLDLDRLRKRCNYKLVGCSALKSESVQESLDWLVDEITSKLYSKA